MKKVKVAVVYHYLAHYREPIFLELSRSINPEYHIFSDIRSNKPNLKLIEYYRKNNQSRDKRLNWKIIKNYWFKNILFQKGVIKLALTNEFDVLILLGNFQFISTWFSLIICKLSKKKTLLWTHGFLRKEKGLKGFIRKVFYSLADGCLLYGNRGKKIMIDMGFDHNKIHVIYNSLNVEKQNSIYNSLTQEMKIFFRENIFPSENKSIIVYVGRLTRERKLEVLFDALNILKKRSIIINLLVIGNGPSYQHYQNYLCQKGLESQVYLYGSCYNEEELGMMIYSSDICVSPGPVGLLSMHSQIYGTPVITNNDFDNQKPEFESIITEKTGGFFKNGNSEDLANQIMKWTKLVENPIIGEECRKVIIEKYNPVVQKKTIDDVIINLIK